MPDSSNILGQSPRKWWIGVFQWLWGALNLFWGTILLGLILNIAATWLVTPLKSINLSDTLLGWLIQHLFIFGFIGISLLIFTIIVGVINYLTAKQTPFTGSETLDRQNRERFLGKLHFRYTQALEQFLRGSTSISLQLSNKTDAVYNPSSEVFRQPNQPDHLLPPGTSILQAYDAAGGELLILGQPGAGKTVLLLELAQELLKRAQNDESHPLPLIFHLSSWANKRLPIADWLVEEMAIAYHISYHLCQMWVNTNHILPLLDGLDEIPSTHRIACIEAINKYQQNHLLPLVVCSRSHDYLLQKAQLVLHSAVVIEPLTKKQVHKYLLDEGKPLSLVRTLLRKNAPLQELVTTPLMLSIFVSTYRGKSAKDLPMAESTNLQQQVFEHYIARMFEHKGIKRPYSEQQTVYWLSWLAIQMRLHNQTEFYLERLQMDWHPKIRFHQLYSSFLVSIVMGLFGWFGYGLFFGSHMGLHSGLVDGLLIGCWTTLIYSMVNGFVIDWVEEIGIKNQASTSTWLNHLLVKFLTSRLVYGLIFGITIGPLIGIRMGIAYGAVAGVRYGIYNVLSLTLDFVLFGKLDKEIHPAEVVTWSWSRTLRVVTRFAVGGLVVGLALGLLFVDNFGLTNAILLGLLFGLSTDVIIGLISGFSHEKLDEQKIAFPNQGMRNSLRNSILFGMLGGSISGSITGIIFALAQGPVSGLIAGVSSGVTVGQIIGLRGGGFAYLQHITLRFLLWRGGYAPWRYSFFLDYAAELVLLHKVGGGYTFVHRLLLDYFASLNL